MADDEYDLSTLVGFTAAYRTGKLARAIHCPACAASRRVHIAPVVDPTPRGGFPSLTSTPAGPIYDPPLVATLSCLECQSTALAVVFESPDGPDLAVLWSVGGGLSSPHTPDGVRYYLDQAARSESVGARSAAVVMYRAALEHLLLDQGYEDRMVGPKLKHLDADIAAGKAKPWAKALAPAFMAVFAKLGNASIHADDKDVSRQGTIDAELLADLHVAMAELLELVYERPRKEAERLARLQAAAAQLKK